MPGGFETVIVKTVIDIAHNKYWHSGYQHERKLRLRARKIMIYDVVLPFCIKSHL